LAPCCIHIRTNAASASEYFGWESELAGLALVYILLCAEEEEFMYRVLFSDEYALPADKSGICFPVV
jgi:hypothetical protein